MTSEPLIGAPANYQDGAGLDISANGVWGGTFEKTYFDVSIFTPVPLQTKTRVSRPAIENTNRRRNVPINKVLARKK